MPTAIATGDIFDSLSLNPSVAVPAPTSGPFLSSSMAPGPRPQAVAPVSMNAMFSGSNSSPTSAIDSLFTASNAAQVASAVASTAQTSDPFAALPRLSASDVYGLGQQDAQQQSMMSASSMSVGAMNAFGFHQSPVQQAAQAPMSSDLQWGFDGTPAPQVSQWNAQVPPTQKTNPSKQNQSSDPFANLLN